MVNAMRKEATKRPNIVILMGDQHRQDVAGCYGNKTVRTPNLDRLAREGVRFDQAYCTSPLCGPSRVSLATGTHPHTNGAVTHPNARHRAGGDYRPMLHAGIQSLYAHLRDAGYRTHGNGYTGFHLYDGNRDLDSDLDFLGFQTQGARRYADMVGNQIARQYNLNGIKGEMWEPAYANVEGKPFPHGEDLMWDSLIAKDAAQFIDSADKGQPFLLYCGFRAPHTPWCPPERFLRLYDPDDLGPLPDYQARHHHVPRRLQQRFEYFDIPHYPERLVRQSIAAYYGFVSYLDDCIGRVLGALDRQGLREDTIVVYLADHGENLYRHGLCEKHCFYQGSVQIPLIFSQPGSLPENVGTEALASIIDVMPTLLAAAGVPVPDFVEGCDLAPALAGNHVRDYVLAEYYHTLDPCRMIFDGHYKYIHTEEDICELYDLRHDPDEMLNLAWYPQYASLVEKYDRLVLADWEIPELPIFAPWNDLSERKQRQRLAGLDILDVRPPLPHWARNPV